MAGLTFTSDLDVDAVDSFGSDTTPVSAARVSTGGGGTRGYEADLRFLTRLLRDGHHSPFEHQAMTFRVHAPVFVTRQLARHRIASYNEVSGRYSELEPVFYLPPCDRPLVQTGKTMDYTFEQNDAAWDTTVDVLRTASAEAWVAYDRLLAGGVAKEAARMVLPVNIYSTIWVTMNTRALLNFFHLRTSDYGSHPQWEIEQVARRMLDLWSWYFPRTYQAAQDAGVLVPRGNDTDNDN